MERWGGMLVLCWFSILFYPFSHSQFAFQHLSPQFFLFHFVAHRNNIFCYQQHRSRVFLLYERMIWGTENAQPTYTHLQRPLFISNLVFPISILCFLCFAIISRKWDRYGQPRARCHAPITSETCSSKIISCSLKRTFSSENQVCSPCEFATGLETAHEESQLWEIHEIRGT